LFKTFQFTLTPSTHNFAKHVNVDFQSSVLSPSAGMYCTFLKRASDKSNVENVLKMGESADPNSMATRAPHCAIMRSAADTSSDFSAKLDRKFRSEDGAVWSFPILGQIKPTVGPLTRPASIFGATENVQRILKLKDTGAYRSHNFTDTITQ
jgi:hypothetical protein